MYISDNLLKLKSEKISKQVKKILKQVLSYKLERVVEMYIW